MNTAANLAPPFSIAAVQAVSAPQVDVNLASVERLVAEAAGKGAQLVLLPEYWPIMGMHETDKVACAEAEGEGPIQDFMAGLAKKHGIWLIGGTMPLKAADPAKVLNTVLVYSPEGERMARYDKIHLFGFSKGTESYDESRTIVPGSGVVTFDAPFGKVGLSVCYDLRFPELYRAMGELSLIVVPAAFTYTTGRAHWELLLRARAVENQCYVLAAAQGGEHPNGRRTWGHTMLIDPWGNIVDQLAEGEGCVIGQVDQGAMAGIRESLPALKHRTM